MFSWYIVCFLIALLMYMMMERRDLVRSMNQIKAHCDRSRELDLEIDTIFKRLMELAHQHADELQSQDRYLRGINDDLRVMKARIDLLEKIDG